MRLREGEVTGGKVKETSVSSRRADGVYSGFDYHLLPVISVLVPVYMGIGYTGGASLSIGVYVY